MKEQQNRRLIESKMRTQVYTENIKIYWTSPNIGPGKESYPSMCVKAAQADFENAHYRPA